MLYVCATALKSIEFSSGDNLFTELSHGDSMVFVLKGRFKYFPADSGGSPRRGSAACGRGSGAFKRANTFRRAEEDNVLTEGQWCCEASLWTHWVTRGHMRAIAISE